MTKPNGGSNEDVRYVPLNKEGHPIKEKDGEMVQPNDHTDLFCTFDLGLSSALVCVGYSLLTLNRSNLRKVQFVFRRTEELDEDVDAYWNDRLEVKARAHFDTIKMLKNRLYSE